MQVRDEKYFPPLMMYNYLFLGLFQKKDPPRMHWMDLSKISSESAKDYLEAET